MILLVEGADYTGKTTLAQEIVRQLIQQGQNAYYIHNGPNDNHPDFQSTQLLTASRLQDTVVVIDRLWLSEQIYGNICRGHSLDPDCTVGALAAKLGVKTILCVRMLRDRHVDDFNNDDRHEYARDNIKKIIETYYDLYVGNKESDFPGVVGDMIRNNPTSTRSEFMHYDMDITNAKEYASWIIQTINP